MDKHGTSSLQYQQLRLGQVTRTAHHMAIKLDRTPKTKKNTCQRAYLRYAEAKPVWKAAWSAANRWTVCSREGRGAHSRAVWYTGAGMNDRKVRRNPHPSPGKQACLCKTSVLNLTASVRGSRNTLSVRKAALPPSTWL